MANFSSRRRSRSSTRCVTKRMPSNRSRAFRICRSSTVPQLPACTLTKAAKLRRRALPRHSRNRRHTFLLALVTARRQLPRRRRRALTSRQVSRQPELAFASHRSCIATAFCVVGSRFLPDGPPPITKLSYKTQVSPYLRAMSGVGVRQEKLSFAYMCAYIHGVGRNRTAPPS